jgi:hypothetical protein
MGLSPRIEAKDEVEATVAGGDRTRIDLPAPQKHCWACTQREAGSAHFNQWQRSIGELADAKLPAIIERSTRAARAALPWQKRWPETSVRAGVCR